MNRLQPELHRLYLTQESAGRDAQAVEPNSIDTAASGTLIDAQGRVRALVLELARPADWPTLSAVWNAVQTDLELPAPAIAVNGRDGYQLWFSLAQPLPAAQGLDWLDALRQRYLADVKPQRLALLPSVTLSTTGATSALPTQHADPVPALQPASGVWSAFVAQDLAPMFADEPWLDLPPNLDGQAKLLARLVSMQATDVERTLGLLRSSPAPAASAAEPPATPGATPAATYVAQLPGAPIGIGPAADDLRLDPRAFLQDVMSDKRVPLALRIEAAKALLPYTQPSSPS